MTDRIPLDELTSDALDQLYADLDRCDEVQGEMNEQAIDHARRIAQLEDLLRIAHNTSNTSETERARAVERANLAQATARRLNRRAQAAESENARYRRAVAQWDVSERGTYIPHASLVAIGKAAGTDILGSVRHLKHFERVERAEAAIERVRALHRPVPSPYGERTICADCSAYGDNSCDSTPQTYPCPTIRALDEHQEQPAATPKEN